MNEHVIDALAVARLARLITADTITLPWRARVIRYAYDKRDGSQIDPVSDQAWQHTVENDHEPPRLAELITCQWCSSIWAAAFVVAARRACPRVWDPLARVLAASMVTGLLTVNAE